MKKRLILEYIVAALLLIAFNIAMGVFRGESVSMWILLFILAPLEVLFITALECAENILAEKMDTYNQTKEEKED